MFSGAVAPAYGLHASYSELLGISAHERVPALSPAYMTHLDFLRVNHVVDEGDECIHKLRYLYFLMTAFKTASIFNVLGFG